MVVVVVAHTAAAIFRGDTARPLARRGEGGGGGRVLDRRPVQDTVGSQVDSVDLYKCKLLFRYKYTHHRTRSPVDDGAGGSRRGASTTSATALALSLSRSFSSPTLPMHLAAAAAAAAVLLMLLLLLLY